MTYPSLCQLAGDWNGAMPAGGWMVERKWDGWRCLYFAGIDGQPRLWSRQGMPLGGLDHIMHRLQRMEEEAGERMFFDGELVVDNSLAATKDWCEREWRFGGEKGVLHLFDAMPFRHWYEGGSDQPLYERKARLLELAKATEGEEWDWRPGSRGRDDPTAVQVLADGWAFDAGDVVTEARRVWAAGGEGLMLKDAEAPYQRTRTDAWRKVKRENFHRWRAAT